jgi:hypothetical protein
MVYLARLVVWLLEFWNDIRRISISGDKTHEFWNDINEIVLDWSSNNEITGDKSPWVLVKIFSR